jgi:hypothetical protein
MKNRWDEENLINCVNKSTNKSETLICLGLKSFTGNYDTLNRYLRIYNIDISHFNRKNQTQNLNQLKIPIEEILVSGSTYSRTSLKKRLFDEGLKERICEKCGQDEMWYGEKMSLILDHINGINNDHRLINLRILCPNCNATLSTHCGRNAKKFKRLFKFKKYTPKNYCSICGVKIKRNSKLCMKCHNMEQRKVQRPPQEQLLNEINVLGYSETGRKYGVSDNAIRKWIK